MSLDELDRLSANDVFDMLGTTEGRETVEAALKNKLESDPELCEKIGQGFFSLLNIAAKSGIKLQEKQGDVLAFLAACKRLSEMPEEEARALLEKAWNEDRGKEDLPTEPNTPYKRPDKYSMVIAKPIKSLFEGKANFTDGKQPVSVGRNRRTKENYCVDVQTFVDSATEQGIELPKLSELDMNVMNGIATLIANGYDTFTPKQVYEAFAGRSTDSKETIAEIRESINLFTRFRISIDWTQHALMKGLPADPDGYLIWEEYFLNADYVSFYQYGQKVEGYKINKLPPFYTYPAAVKQIATFDRELLEAPHTREIDAVRADKPTVLLKTRLVRRINQMKTEKKQWGNYNESVIFEPLYDLAGVGENRTQRGRLRTTIFKILDSWKEEQTKKRKEESFFFNYEVEKKGAKFHAVKIYLTKDDWDKRNK